MPSFDRESTYMHYHAALPACTTDMTTDMPEGYIPLTYS